MDLARYRVFFYERFFCLLLCLFLFLHSFYVGCHDLEYLLFLRPGSAGHFCTFVVCQDWVEYLHFRPRRVSDTFRANEDDRGDQKLRFFTDRFCRNFWSTRAGQGANYEGTPGVFGGVRVAHRRLQVVFFEGRLGFVCRVPAFNVRTFRLGAVVEGDAFAR